MLAMLHAKTSALNFAELVKIAPSAYDGPHYAKSISHFPKANTQGYAVLLGVCCPRHRRTEAGGTIGSSAEQRWVGKPLPSGATLMDWHEIQQLEPGHSSYPTRRRRRPHPTLPNTHSIRISWIRVDPAE